MKILVSTMLLSPYRSDWLNELGKNNELDILALDDGNAERNQNWLAKRPQHCSYRLMNGISIPKLGKISFSVINCIKHGGYDIIILDGYGFATQVVNMVYLNCRKIPYYVNVDGIVESDNDNKVKTWYKTKLLSKIPHILCGSKATDKVLQKYGVALSRIINHPFTSLFKKDIFSDIATTEEKQHFREKYGMTEKHIVISVGRFTYLGGYGKGYDVLIKAAEKMDDNVGWYIVGGQPTEEFANIVREKNLKNVHFVDFVEKETLKDYYRASDVFALMTVSDVWGLVVNEAMACGLPVITTDKCMAGLDLVHDGENGYIVGVGDFEALVDKLSLIFGNEQTLKSFSAKALEVIREYTIEKMADIHTREFEREITK